MKEAARLLGGEETQGSGLIAPHHHPSVPTRQITQPLDTVMLQAWLTLGLILNALLGISLSSA